MQLNPWGSDSIKDYDKLTKEFGIQPFEALSPELQANHYFRRGIVFGHRDFDKFWADYKARKTVSMVTGIMPNGPMHIGHKMVVDQAVFFQDLGVKPYIVVADFEARNARGVDAETVRRLTLEDHLLNWIALGLDPKKADVYAQSNRSIPYYAMASLLAGRVTMAEMTAIYGELSPGKLVSALTQVADILHPQLKDYNGPHSVLVPVGSDQDPHIRLTRGLAEKEKLVKPASTYTRYATGLTGGKMSKSEPASAINLNDSVEVAVKKASNVFTGGRTTTAEQREKGGDIKVCVVYELYAYHFMQDDKELQDIYRRCTKGELLCGECKQILKKKVESFMKAHAKKREKAKKKVEKMVIFG